MRHLIVTDSDNIFSVGFDASGSDAEHMWGALEVVFKPNTEEVYRYEHVRFETFVKLIGAESIGKACHELLRKTKHPFTKSTKPPTLKK